MMDDDHPIWRKRRLDNELGHDFLSDLPLGIIHEILDLIPMKDAIRTCILSRKWRYTWTTLTDLSFDHTCVDQKGKSIDIFKDRFKKFITGALSLHQGPITRFELTDSLLGSCPDTDHWLLWLSRKEIKELQIESLFRVHSSLYSCEKLTLLELIECELPSPPLTFKGFSYLVELFLWNVKVCSDTVQRLASNSPLLNIFRSYDSVRLEFKVSAPKLTVFALKGDFKEISLYAPVVASMSVALTEDYFTDEHLQMKSSVCNYTKFLGGFTNLERLSVKCFFPKYLSIGIESYDHSLVFNKLELIKLYLVKFQDMKEMSVVVHLITSAPNLQQISMSSRRSRMTEDSPEAAPIDFTDFGCSPNFTFEKLRVVVMKNVQCLSNEMEFIKLLLKSSPVLETMTIYYSSILVPQGIINLTTELLSYSRTSPNAKILLRQRQVLLL